MKESPPQRGQYTLDRLARLLVTALALVGIVLLLRYLSDVLLPFALAVVLAYLLNPLVDAFERRMHRRGLSVALTLAGLGLVAAAVTAIVIPLMVWQIGRFRDDLAKLRGDLVASWTPESAASDAAARNAADAETADEAKRDSNTKDPVEPRPTTWGWVELKAAWSEFRRTADQVPRARRFAQLRRRIEGTYAGDVMDQAVAFVRSEDFQRMLVSAGRRLAVGGWTALSFLFNAVIGLIGLIVVLLYLVFLLLDYPHYSRAWRDFLPPAYRDATVEFVEQFHSVLRRYFRGQFVVAALSGVLLAVGFTIIGLPMAVPFGLFVGLLSMIPYLPAVAIVPAILLAGMRAVQGESGLAMSVILTLAVLAIVQVVQEGLIVPRVMGRATGLRPLAILLGVFIWGKLLGVMGLVLAIPLTCLAIACYQRYVLGAGSKPAAPSPVLRT